MLTLPTIARVAHFGLWFPEIMLLMLWFIHPTYTPSLHAPLYSLIGVGGKSSPCGNNVGPRCKVFPSTLAQHPT